MMKMCSDRINNMSPAGMMGKGMGMMQRCMATTSGGKDETPAESTPDQAIEAKSDDSHDKS